MLTFHIFLIEINIHVFVPITVPPIAVSFLEEKGK